MNVPRSKSQISNFRHRKSTLNCMETGFQCPRSTLPVGIITVLSHLEVAQIRISMLRLDPSKLVSPDKIRPSGYTRKGGLFFHIYFQFIASLVSLYCQFCTIDFLLSSRIMQDVAWIDYLIQGPMWERVNKLLLTNCDPRASRDCNPCHTMPMSSSDPLTGPASSTC